MNKFNLEINQTLKNFENMWFNDFRAYPFDDTNIIIFDEENNKECLDIDELQKELENLISYLETKESENEEEAMLSRGWKVYAQIFLDYLKVSK